MAEKDQQIIIVKKKGGGHGGAHGGAWKVAFADFMTAMMAFFLVMWLMGSDEEIRASVSHYFNNPTSVWRKDVSSDKTVPLGEQTGAGESVLNGLDGQLPEDLISEPIRNIVKQDNPTNDEIKFQQDLVEGKFPLQDFMNLEILKFSIPQRALFEDGTAQFSSGSNKYLAQLEDMIKKYQGHVMVSTQIVDASDPEFGDGTQSSHITDPFDFSMARSVAVRKYLTDRRVVDSRRIQANVIRKIDTIDSGRNPAGNKHIRFTLSVKKQ